MAQNRSCRFNFGSQNSFNPNSFIQIDAKTFYSKKNKFGLLTNDAKNYQIKKKWAKITPEIASGIITTNAIQFRAEIQQGEYYIEISMDGGNSGHWQGDISVNDSSIIKDLYSFTSDPESDEAPNYWAVLRKIKTTSSVFKLSIKAKNQNSSLSSLILIPAKDIKLKLINGKIIADKNFFAPNSKLAIDLINNGSIKEAMRYIDAIPGSMFGKQKAELLFAAAGRLETENPVQLISNALRILKEEKNKNNSTDVDLDIKAAELYIYADQSYKSGGWDWTKELTQTGIFDHINSAGMAYKELTQLEKHPLQIRAMYALAKVSFWIWVEQHTQRLLDNADKYFKIVQKYYPDNKLIKMYLGERICSVEYSKWDKEIPKWAYLQKKALDGVLDIIHYWVKNRQADNGEFGGKYDDDVEMLRWWPVSRTVVEDPVALIGMKRLVDGIWNSIWIERGWSRKLRDVEHSSEPIADTQPMMIGFDYGNPIYVERCMATAEKLNLWTGINKKGHRHFKSSWYSATAIDTTAPKDCDVEMNTRTIKAVNWLAWYNHHPAAMKFLREWADAWYEDCMSTDKDKPKGIVPAAIRYDDDEICGYSENWYESGMYWDYYNFRNGSKILNQFLVSYLLFNDAKYLKPIELALDLVQKYNGEDLTNSISGSEKWTAGILLSSNQFAEAVEMWRLITGNSKYDELIKSIGSDYIKFRLTGDEEAILDGLNNIINGTYNNRELMTTEAYFTDRVEIRDLRGGDDWGVALLESMYTGSPMVDTFYPFNPVSWRGFGKNFSVIVLNTSSESIKIKIINLTKKKINGSIVFHQLENGKYKYTLSLPETNQIDSNKIFEVKKRNSELNISLQPLKEEIINIQQVGKYPTENFELADLAITRSELKIGNLKNGKIKVSIPVHNIGIKDAENIEAAIFKNEINRVASKAITEIKAPIDLQPKIKIVEFVIPNKSGNYEIRINGNSSMEEITTLNNKISFTINSN